MPGPPLVILKIKSKVLSDSTHLMKIINIRLGFKKGKVMCIITCNLPAPSNLAASIGALGISSIEDAMRMAIKKHHCHVSTAMIDGRASFGEDKNGIGLIPTLPKK